MDALNTRSSTGCSMLEQAIQGPTPEQWEKMKEHIYQLYIVQGQPLKTLIPTMKAKYGFDATPKMYCTHFKKWSPRFNKNKKANDGSEPTSSIKMLRKRPRRLASHHPTPPWSHLLSIQPRPSANVQLSDGYEKQRAVIKFAEVYVCGLFDTFNFSSNLFDIIVPPGTPDHSIAWQQIGDECFGALTLLSEGRYTEGNQTFSIACNRLNNVLGSNDCGMIIKLWPICLRLYRAGLKLNNFAMLEYFLHLFCRIALHHYPQGHPIPSLLKVLCQASTEELFNIVQVGYLRTIHCLERSLGFGNAVMLSVWSNYLKKADDHALPASALTSRYESVLQEAQNSFTPIGTRTIEILHQYTYAAYYNAKDYDLTWNLASQMVNLAESFELMSDHPEWCLATQGYAMAAKLMYILSQQTGHGDQGTVILRSAISRLELGDRECRTRALMLGGILVASGV